VSAGRRSARRQAVFILYQQDLLKLEAEAALRRFEDGEVTDYARRIVLGAQAEREWIDATLGQHVTGWTVERLGALERSILRAAVYELLAEADVPEAVVVDQAVTLAKRFCSAEAGALVNGILGSLAAATRSERHAGDSDEVSGT
jgi:N utilization substance protein B